MSTLLFDGLSTGMLLFVLASGFAVTLGAMNFVNLAHGAFAMAGGYVTVIAMQRFGVPFLATLPLAFILTAGLGLGLERTLYRRLHDRPHIDQVLFSIGLVFMAMAAVNWIMGPSPQTIRLPAALTGRFDVLGVGIGRYRLFLVGVCGALALGLQAISSHTRFGARLRAAVDDRRVARGLGLPVEAIFAVTFAVGSGLAGLGGALGAEVLGLDPSFPIKYMIWFLIVVIVGGSSSIVGPLVAALMLGIADAAAKYFVPQAGAFVVYALVIVVLIARPNGLFARAGR